MCKCRSRKLERRELCVREPESYLTVTTVALVMNPKCEPDFLVRHLRRITKAVDSKASNWREKKLDIASRYQFGI